MSRLAICMIRGWRFRSLVRLIPAALTTDSRVTRHPRARPGDQSRHGAGLDPRVKPGDDVEACLEWVSRLGGWYYPMWPVEIRWPELILNKEGRKLLPQ